ncbi:hypothetical protein Sjap_014341 [Stephania japonica]|uniref:Uncharacterized protein n=1 Tax=Stephania japonica TaxID=461633 RepID=A0AAP0IZT5_9MAGN
MATKVCTNASCGATSSIKWRCGWRLRSGAFATLCDQCGSAYEQSTFCDTYHSKESGWRDCSSCGKRLHCGCIASKSLLELLDNGGIGCISCVRRSGSTPTDEKIDGFATRNNVTEVRSASIDNNLDTDNVDVGRPLQSGDAEGNEQNSLLQSGRDDKNESVGKIKREQIVTAVGEVGSSSFSNFNHSPIGSSLFSKRCVNKESVGARDLYDSLAQTCLSITLGAPGNTNLVLDHNGTIEGGEHSRALPSLEQGQRSRHLMPKPPKMNPGIVQDATTKEMLPQIRVARPPVEGRGRNQLLPRYWPRITDQELQQISGDSNSTIVPLFEKVLSASDAGRIGRLVLPKACAEAYFPPISQPEGLPLKIQDVKGKDWVFQFRFWPNNNSRMYVLEGVTPCIQSMQLQAGDTVTFSRLDPEGKLVMGFRKASSCATLQKLPVISSYSGLLQSMKGSPDLHINALSESFHAVDGDLNWRRIDRHGGRPNEGLAIQPLLVPEKKRSRNIGSKSKRLLIDSEDALELKLTWEEAQDLLRPPPSAKPSIVMIEDHEFEEYEEPPVFGKKTIFTVRSSGGQDQWAQCDNCSKWRRLPVDVLLPPKWSCIDNAWDPKRCVCSAAEELSPMDRENLLKLDRDLKKRRIMASQKPIHELEPSGLDALATAAVLGEERGDSGAACVATTTKHPRHRPGCTCIVCIQPPSGKGPKHKPTCTCTVCMTVKRRFKTLMMRKKKRQTEAEVAQRNPPGWGPKDEIEVDSASRGALLALDSSDPEGRQAVVLESGGHGNAVCIDKAVEMNKAGKIDLNCHPYSDDQDAQAAVSERMSMMSLLQVASLPLETYLKQNGLDSLVATEPQASSTSQAQQQPVVESEEKAPEDSHLASAGGERVTTTPTATGGNEGSCRPDNAQTDPV